MNQDILKLYRDKEILNAIKPLRTEQQVTIDKLFREQMKLEQERIDCTDKTNLLIIDAKIEVNLFQLQILQGILHKIEIKEEVLHTRIKGNMLG